MNNSEAPNTSTHYAIKRTFPDGQILGDGFIRAGDHYPQPVAPFYSLADAEQSAARMRDRNPGHLFIIVPYPVAD